MMAFCEMIIFPPNGLPWEGQRLPLLDSVTSERSGKNTNAALFHPEHPLMGLFVSAQ